MRRVLVDLPGTSLPQRRTMPGRGGGGRGGRRGCNCSSPCGRESHVALPTAGSGLEPEHTLASRLLWPGGFTLFGKRRVWVTGLAAGAAGGSRSPHCRKRRAGRGQAVLPAPSAGGRPRGRGTETRTDRRPNFRVPGSGRCESRRRKAAWASQQPELRCSRNFRRFPGETM